MDKLIRITTVPVSLLILLKSQLKFMSNYYEVIAVSSGGEMLDQVRDQAGVKTVSVEMTRKITPIKDLIALWNLYKLIKKERPKFVHTHTPKAGLLGMIAASMAGVPVRLHTVAGMPLLESTGLKRKMLDVIEKITYGFATKVYPNSNQMKEIILENKYCKSSKLHVIGNGSSNGIDTSYFSPNLFIDKDTTALEAKMKLREKHGISPTALVYCFIGRMVKDKGLKELVNAFVEINKTRPETRLILVGPFENDLDPLDAYTDDQVKNHPAIIWVGFQKDVRPYLFVSDIFVFPSYREGFPNVVMQSGAMGLPSIVSDINGCNEIIVDYENGIIVPPKSEEKLRNAMAELYDNTQLRTKLAKNSRAMILSRYDQNYIWGELLREYRQLNIN
ncbi:MAG: glycosyl transferase group 1 [Sphingobacteriales bacterium]|nr:glycosyl transferase group 1 [Sphingobacteriales bacterium]